MGGKKRKTKAPAPKKKEMTGIQKLFDCFGCQTGNSVEVKILKSEKKGTLRCGNCRATFACSLPNPYISQPLDVYYEWQDATHAHQAKVRHVKQTQGIQAAADLIRTADHQSEVARAAQAPSGPGRGRRGSSGAAASSSAVPRNRVALEEGQRSSKRRARGRGADSDSDGSMDASRSDVDREEAYATRAARLDEEAEEADSVGGTESSEDEDGGSVLGSVLADDEAGAGEEEAKPFLASENASSAGDDVREPDNGDAADGEMLDELGSEAGGGLAAVLEEED